MSTNSLVGPLLTDLYQLTMAYSYWKNGRCDDPAIFDLFFRKNPFHGEYCVFAGLDEVLKLLMNFRFSESDIAYLQNVMPACEPEFFSWLQNLDCSKVKLYSMLEGSVVFPREPLLRVEGPLAIAQLLETTLLNLINFPSLIATNAARMRLAAGSDKILLEFGLRRAQGPDGGLSASKYSQIGGFDGTSNVLAGKLAGIVVKGTHAHSFVMSYSKLSELKLTTLYRKDDVTKSSPVNFVELVLKKRDLLKFNDTNEGELAAFIAYAISFPNGFMALVDTYDTLNSGVKNFIAVGWALYDLGYKPIGIRLDSGDLAYLSKETRKKFQVTDQKHNVTIFSQCNIVASNDINEEVLLSLNRQGHEINTYGIGTHLVTCQSQPALGCVYKLVEVNGQPRIKLSQDKEKLVIPGKKRVYRLYSGVDGHPLLDLLIGENEKAPEIGQKILVRHPFEESKRAYVTAGRVEPMLHLVFDGSLLSSTDGSHGLTMPIRTLAEAKAFCMNELKSLRPDHIRSLNPTPYKLSVSQSLYEYMHNLWMVEAPIADLS